MRLCAAIAVIGIGLPVLGVPATGFADDGLLPMMDRDQPVQCMHDKDGKVWRIQCNAAAKVCLYAIDQELDSTGEPAKPLERARDCAPDASFERANLIAAGFTLVAARADAPWGWTRDERGRVFQVNFDLKRRMYFGAGYTPRKIVENPFESKRTSLDFGLFIFEYLDRTSKTPTRHRLRLLEGEVHVAPFASEVVVAHYDMSHHFLDPLLRITTFVGTPSRHDLHLDLGLWTEAGGLEIHPTTLGRYSQLWKNATGQVTLDLWQSPSLDSYVRVRTGLGLEGQRDDVNGYRSALTATSALELDFVLDDAGFHNLRFEIDHEIPRYFTPVGLGSRYSQRFRAKLQYEAVVLAINDQPLTLKLAAGGEKRDDIPGVPDQWAFVMDAGLRFNLWAPPRPRL